LHGPVRAAENAGAGDATVIISFNAWDAGKVAPTVHTIRIEKPRTQISLEPVAPQLKKTLVHPDRKASVGQMQFSADGTRLFVSGYPSGVVQVFDMTTGKELRRIAGPRGFRSSSAYAVPSADWKTVYIAVENRKGERVIKDGKSQFVPKYTGEVRVFDLTTGEEKPALAREGNGAVSTVALGPDGKTLIARETTAGMNEKGDRTITSRVIEWDPMARTHKVLHEGYVDDHRSKDGRWAAAATNDYEKLSTSLKLTDIKTGKETVLVHAEKKRVGYVLFSPDSRFLVANTNRYGSDAGGDLLVWNLETLQEVKAPTMKDAVLDMGYAPDGAHLAVWDHGTGTRLIDAKNWKERPLPGRDDKLQFARFAFSVDGRWFAVVAVPNYDQVSRVRDPDPLDFPQPKIYLCDLTRDTPPRVMVCPQGFVVNLAFDPKGKWLAAGASGGVWLFDVGK
jgi:WD40 repeat protein